VPVVASNAGGLPELIKEGETGYMRNVGDVDGMAAAAAQVLRDADRWRAMSAAAAKDARARFSQDEIVSRYERFYESVVG